MNAIFSRRHCVSAMLKFAALPLILLIASGCATVVYKDGASTFVAAGRALSKQLSDASVSLASAEDAVRLSRLVTDSSCPVAEARLFVRPPASELGSYPKLLARYPALAREGECVLLAACDDSRAADSRCKSACYTREESYCLANLERNYAIDVAKQEGKSEADAFSKDASLLASRLKNAEYGRAAPLENKVLGTSLQALTEYLDLLSKVAEDRKTEIPDDAKKLSDGLKTATDELAKLTGTQLSADTKAQRTKVQEGIGALGKFFGTIDALVQNAKDVEQIRKLVNENKNAVPELVEAVRPIFKGDAYLIAALNNRANFAFRQDIEQRFRRTRDEFERKQLLAELAKYPVGSGPALQASVDKIFDSLLKAHTNLVSLINNPTDEQLKKIRSEEFNTFKALIEDALGVLALVK